MEEKKRGRRREGVGREEKKKKKGRGVVRGGGGGVADGDAQLFGAVGFAKLFNFVAALGGKFRGLVEIAVGGDGNDDFFPLGSFELAMLERVPFFLVSTNEMRGFLVGPLGGRGGGGGGGVELSWSSSEVRMVPYGDDGVAISGGGRWQVGEGVGGGK